MLQKSLKLLEDVLRLIAVKIFNIRSCWRIFLKQENKDEKKYTRTLLKSSIKLCWAYTIIINLKMLVTFCGWCIDAM